MNLVVIPFHDWRKVQREGGRTRDAHMIRELAHSERVDSVLVVNRPISWAEMLYRRTWWKSEGEVISADSRGHLVQVAPKTFVLDTLDKSIVAPLISGKRHFFDAYGDNSLLASVNWHRLVLGMSEFACISFNIYAAALFEKLECERKHFDGWDNFLRFPSNQRMQTDLKSAYEAYSRTASSWSTNSEENRAYYDVMFGLDDCAVIKNGVSPELFTEERELPEDMIDIPRPIVGMGLKVTHLLDADLLSQVVWSNPSVSFVLIGQILDHAVFERIRRVSNFHYLGDKHYRDYPAYVKNFDACLVPYCVGDKQHGGDAIKFYEYLAAGKPIVATPGNGVSDEYEGVWVTSSPTEFAEAVRAAVAMDTIQRRLPEDIRWSDKANQLLDAVNRREARKEAYVL